MTKTELTEEEARLEKKYADLFRFAKILSLRNAKCILHNYEDRRKTLKAYTGKVKDRLHVMRGQIFLALHNKNMTLSFAKDLLATLYVDIYEMLEWIKQAAETCPAPDVPLPPAREDGTEKKEKKDDARER